MKLPAIFLLICSPFLTLQLNQDIQETFDRYDKDKNNLVSYD